MTKPSILILCATLFAAANYASAAECSAPAIGPAPRNLVKNLGILITESCLATNAESKLTWLKSAFPGARAEKNPSGSGYSIKIVETNFGGMHDHKFDLSIDSSDSASGRKLRITLRADASLHLSRDMLFEELKIEPLKEFMPSPHLTPGAKQEAFLLRKMRDQRIIVTSSPSGDIVDISYEEDYGG